MSATAALAITLFLLVLSGFFVASEAPPRTGTGRPGQSDIDRGSERDRRGPRETADCRVPASSAPSTYLPSLGGDWAGRSSLTCGSLMAAPKATWRRCI